MRIVRLISNLGYGGRKEVAAMFREGRITDASGDVLYADDKREHPDIRVDGEPLDPPIGLTLMLNKPVGYTCSTTDPGGVVYDLLPERFRHRSPTIASVGRLDRDTTGLLLMTDDGALLHRIVAPKAKLQKIYRAQLARDLKGDEGNIFASGNLKLESERTPLAPANSRCWGRARRSSCSLKAATIKRDECSRQLAITSRRCTEARSVDSRWASCPQVNGESCTRKTWTRYSAGRLKPRRKRHSRRCRASSRRRRLASND